ncbi:MAG: hypothetical protein DSY33_01590 [Archaeoglobus sp.]|nr:MAG: hypothetical protein DSY33_01590 [Archaeoglobus sp.]
MKKVIGLLLLIVGLMLAVGAGANFRYYHADRKMVVNITADDNELINLKPLQNYSYLNDGKLTIEISPNNPNYIAGEGIGMSHNTTYVFEEMFEVSNELWENNKTNFPIHVTISVPINSGVEVFAGDYYNNGTASIANPATQIQFTVQHGTPVKVGFIFNNTCEALGSHQVNMYIQATA